MNYLVLNRSVFCEEMGHGSLDLAHAFLNYVKVSKQEQFPKAEAERLKKEFEVWKNTYTEKMEEVVSIAPTCESRALELHNITSMPQKWSFWNFWSTSDKRDHSDPLEKQRLQENLSRVAKAHYTSNFGTCANSLDKENLSDFRFLASIEQLARGYAYHTPEQGGTLEVYSPNKGELIEYEVEIIPIALGIEAFGLTPKNDREGKPILLFRGTSFYPSGKAAGATILTDLDPLGIGYSSYQISKKRLTAWIEKAAGVSSNGKVVVTGHSLGSAYATYAAIDHHEKIDHCYGFGATKVSVLFYRKWLKVKDRLKITHFNVPGDHLVTFSHVRIASAYYEATTKTPLPKEETIGKSSLGRQDRFARSLTAVKPNSASHRVSHLDKATVLRRGEIPSSIDWISVAMKVVGCFLIYIPFCILFGLKRLLLGYSEQPGLLLLPFYLYGRCTEGKPTTA